MDKIKLVIIVGPTALGKSRLAMELAERFNGEIVNADSRQVYRYMDIGTAKSSHEDRRRVPHHLIDIVDPDEDFTAARFRTEAMKVIQDIYERGRNIFVAGGTGLYIKALIGGLFKGPGADEGLRGELRRETELEGADYLYQRLKEVDPVAASCIHPHNMVRVIRALEVFYLTDRPISSFQREHGFLERPYETLKVGLIKDRRDLYRDIEARVDRMIEAGLIEEVRGLGYPPTLKAMQGLGYREIVDYLHGKYTLEEAIRRLKRNTRRYAKRQMTWFRNDRDIHWFPPEDRQEVFSLVEGFLYGKSENGK